jgi:hypothetical protein
MSRIAVQWLATSWTTGVRFPAGTGIFLCIMTSILALGSTQSPIQWLRDCFLGGKARLQSLLSSFLIFLLHFFLYSLSQLLSFLFVFLSLFLVYLPMILFVSFC